MSFVLLHKNPSKTITCLFGFSMKFGHLLLLLFSEYYFLQIVFFFELLETTLCVKYCLHFHCFTCQYIFSHDIPCSPSITARVQFSCRTDLLIGKTNTKFSHLNFFKSSSFVFVWFPGIATLREEVSSLDQKEAISKLEL